MATASYTKLENSSRHAHAQVAKRHTHDTRRTRRAS
jgi:hypothetical protein